MSKNKIHYSWKSKPMGYTRIIPDDGDMIKEALTSIKRAKKQGVRFDIAHGFYGLKVTVVTLSTHTPRIKRWEL